jgi:uncharacterized phage protein gp47/JayE
MVRDSVRAYLPGADAAIANSVLRVMSDAMGAICHLTLQYIDWLALQLLPDTAEQEWLDRHANIWLVNADGSTGRKTATLADGSATMTGVGGAVVPEGQQLIAGSVGMTGVTYETTEEITIDADTPTPVTIRALDPGTIGNQLAGSSLALINGPPNVDAEATVVELINGTDTETDDELRARVLRRIRQPPMGGAAYDYEAWALAVPGVTRAWAVGNQQGIGTATVRFMMDDLRADNDGFPLPDDVDTVAAYVNSKRPVTVKECYVLAPLKQPIDFALVSLNPDTPAIRGAIEASIQQMLYFYAAPGQTIYAAWKYAAVMAAPGVISFDMTTQEDDVMPAPGYMAVLGDIYYSTAPTPTVAQIEQQQKLITHQHG